MADQTKLKIQLKNAQGNKLMPVTHTKCVQGLLGEDNKINISLLPEINNGIDLKFNGLDVQDGQGITALDFTGTTTVTVVDGVGKIQIGENMNSSAWAIKDGKQGDGTVTGAPALTSVVIPDVNGTTTAGFKVGDWQAGTAQTAGTTSSTVTLKSKSYIHFNHGINQWNIKVLGQSEDTVLLQAKVQDTVAYTPAGAEGVAVKGAEIATSAVQYITGTAGVTHALTANTIALQDNYPAAVGARAQVSFTIALASIPVIANGGRFRIVISGCGGTYTSSWMFYVKQKAPVITGQTLAVNAGSFSTKKVSGVQYVTAATFTASTGAISNLNNQAGLATKLVCSSSYFSNADSSVTSTELTGYTTKWDNNAVTYTDSDLALAGNLNLQNSTVSMTLKAQNAYSSHSVAATTLDTFNINTYAQTLSTDSTQSFLKQNLRLAYADYSTFDQQASLASDQLQVIPGKGLTYPSVNYKTATYPADNVDYSGLITTGGKRYFVRYFKAGTGTVTGGTFTMTGLGAAFADAAFSAQLSIDDGDTWYDMKTIRGDEAGIGILNSYTQSTGKVVFTYPKTSTSQAADGVLVRIGWTEALPNLVISKMVLTLGDN